MSNEAYIERQHWADNTYAFPVMKHFTHSVTRAVRICSPKALNSEMNIIRKCLQEIAFLGKFIGKHMKIKSVDTVSKKPLYL